MPKQYTKAQIALQRRFGVEPLAAVMSTSVIRSELSERDSAFIKSRDMFFLATVDASGQPTCSYKGGDPGFVQVLDLRTLLFPLYDGNSMYLSAGNVVETSLIGMLFLDFETPHRLRVEGMAEILHDSQLFPQFPEAQLSVRVAVRSVYVNCPRYVHRYARVGSSKYVPRAGQETPLAQWKRIDAFQSALPARDAAKIDINGGTLTMEEYRERLARGDA